MASDSSTRTIIPTVNANVSGVVFDEAALFFLFVDRGQCLDSAETPALALHSDITRLTAKPKPSAALF